jgi:hypothetical protein
MYNPQAARDDFQNAAKIFQNAVNLKRSKDPDIKKQYPLALGDIIEMYQLTQSTLRLEQPIVLTSPLYTFPISVTQQGAQAPFLTEIRLQQTDTFVPTQIYVGFGNAANTADIAFKVVPYPSPVLFPTGFPSMQTLYNGQLKFLINNYQYLYGWDLMRHYCANQTQQTAAAGPGSPIDQIDGSMDGYYPMQPFVLFNGLQNLNFQLILPGSITAVDGAARIVVMLRGVIAQNSTVAV